MARALSIVARQAVFAQETKEVFLLLLTITHAAIPDPIRVANNTQAIISGGETFVGYPFAITLPDEREDGIPQMSLRIDNVSRSIVQALRSITSAPSIQLDVVLADQPDTLEASFTGFTLRRASYDAVVVEGALTLEDVLNQAFPALSFTPSTTPALF
jgi:hypothetical protein